MLHPLSYIKAYAIAPRLILLIITITASLFAMELKTLPLNDQQMFLKRFIRNVTKKMNFEKMLIKANKFSKPTIAIRFSHCNSFHFEGVRTRRKVRGQKREICTPPRKFLNQRPRKCHFLRFP